LRKRFISLPKEETTKGTYFISRALTYELSTSEFSEYYKESSTLSFNLVLVTLICSVTALTSESFKNAKKLDTYKSVCFTFFVTSEYRHIRPTFAIILILTTLTAISSFLATLILDLTSFCLALSLALILILSFFCLALSAALILIVSSFCLASSSALILILSSLRSALSFLIISLIRRQQ
jgi:hypothetical protein